ncbi:hypothetical protein F4804DRAFT_336436 [Jackrogersella minutella]|nr:hypothetical protein F4804DRAFT_336436 [Jackrogersella minutella]
MQENGEVSVSSGPEMVVTEDFSSRFNINNNNNGWRESVVDLEHDSLEDVEMEDSPMTMTPAQTEVAPPPTTISRAFARPMTRSMSKSSFAEPLEALPYTTTTSLRARLQTSSKNPTIPNLTISRLEQSRDIDYGDDEEADEPGEDDIGENSKMKDEDGVLVSPSLEKLLRKQPETGQLQMQTRRSSRIGNHNATNDPICVAPAALTKRQSRRASTKSKAGTPRGCIRRSPRLWKPLTEFHQYTELPPELKMMIWEAAIEPRLLYICNRSSIAHVGGHFGTQNRPPLWFNACRLSRWIAQLHYKKRFGLYSQFPPTIDHRTIQDVNTNDVVIFEPCHGACRGCHCARHQYCDADRSAVRFMAVQTESPSLPNTTEPCWQTITRSWPNVETLYLMRVAVRGVDMREKAMIRVRANFVERALLDRFKQWKKGPGVNVKVNRIEFVEVVQKENATGNPRDQYQSVTDRLTGSPEDMILD